MDIKTLINTQNEFSKAIKGKKEVCKEDIRKDILLALFVELGEFANELEDFKYWKTNKRHDKEKILEEFADIILIWGSLANALNFTSEEVEQAINKKISKNFERQKNGY